MRMKIIAAVGAALMLCGCIEVKQDFKFADDGTVKVAMRLGLAESLVEMVESSDEKPFCGEETVETVEKRGIKATVHRSTENDIVTCSFEFEGPAKAVLDTLNSGDLMPGADQSDDDPQMNVELTRDGDDLVFLVSIPPFGSGSEDADDPMAKGMEKMFLASMAGRLLSWSITAPKIVKTTGELSADGNTASFSVPLTQAFTNKEKTYEFRTVFQTSNPSAYEWVESASE